MSVLDYAKAILQALGNKLNSNANDIYAVIVPLIAIALAVLLLMVLIIAFQARWRPLRVFISYKHSYGHIAESIRHFLRAQGKKFDVQMLDFEERSHDQTVAEVRRMIRRADLMICIPDPQAPSFVNAEILAMSVLNRPIVLVRHTESQLLPHTALSGYPVLRFDALKRANFKPLADYCLFIGRHYSDLKRLLQRLAPALIVVELFKDLKVYGILILLAVLTGFAGWVALKAFVGIILALTLLVVLAIVILGWTTDIKAVRVARQEMLSGNTTYEKLSDALGDLGTDSGIEECLDKAVLPSKHG